MNIIRQRQPPKAAGFTPTKPFSHKSKIRRTTSPINRDQHTRMSPWNHIETAATKVDKGRVNWKGILYVQQECGMFDPRPRLVKKAS